MPQPAIQTAAQGTRSAPSIDARATHALRCRWLMARRLCQPQKARRWFSALAGEYRRWDQPIRGGFFIAAPD